MTATHAVPEAQAPDVIEKIIRESIQEIGNFVARPEFQELLGELYALPVEQRAEFVHRQILDADAIRGRGITVPEDMSLLRSAFGDGRPTLFCVSKAVPLAFPWHRVTVTFDSN
jgi:hypothetical protein